MKKFSYFSESVISRHDQKSVLGGKLDALGGASADCGGGKKVTCSGSECTSTDKGPGQEGGCACFTGDSGDIKSCKDV